MVSKYEGYSFYNDIVLRCNNIICVLCNDELRSFILNKDHQAICIAHPRFMTMKVYINPLLLWKGMKEDLVRYVMIFL
jgi:hypothetical protein